MLRTRAVETSLPVTHFHVPEVGCSAEMEAVSLSRNAFSIGDGVNVIGRDAGSYGFIAIRHKSRGSEASQGLFHGQHGAAAEVAVALCSPVVHGHFGPDNGVASAAFRGKEGNAEGAENFTFLAGGWVITCREGNFFCHGSFVEKRSRKDRFSFVLSECERMGGLSSALNRGA